MLQVSNAERTFIFQARFSMGRVLMTRGVEALVQDGTVDPLPLLARHASGDWGDMCEADKRTNDRGIDQECQLMSAYGLSEQVKIWIITEWDRSVTTLLLPSEY